MDVYGQVRDDFGTSFHFPTRKSYAPITHPIQQSLEAACCTIRPQTHANKIKKAFPKVRKSPLRRRTEPLGRTKRDASTSRSKSKSSTGVTLPTWVLEQYMEEHNQILCGDL